MEDNRKENSGDGYREGEVFSKSVRAGKRTYFFDVKSTRSGEYYLTITESKRRFNNEQGKFFYEKHKLFLYKEDFNRFLASLEDAIDHVKTELMPEYDYDEYTRRHEEYEARQEEAAEQEEKPSVENLENLEKEDDI